MSILVPLSIVEPHIVSTSRYMQLGINFLKVLLINPILTILYKRPQT